MNWENAKKKKKYILIPVYIVCYIISYLTGIRCIWKHFFGIPCPGCGFTRSVISMVCLDFKSAWHYHPMFWSSFLILAYFVFEGDVFRNKKVNAFVGWGIVAGFLIVWIVRLVLKIDV